MPQIQNKTINTRSSNKYIYFTLKNDTFNKSFFPVVTKLYNNLDLSIREGFKKSKWKFKMAFAMKGGGS